MIPFLRTAKHSVALEESEATWVPTAGVWIATSLNQSRCED
jgi:hypothetical protein